MKFRKSLYVLPMLLASALAIASIDPIAELNENIAEILKPLQNERTEALVNFQAIEILPAGVKKLAFASGLKKVGLDALNTAEISLNGNYENLFDGADPKTELQFAANFDLTSVLPQKDINELGGSFEELIKALIEEQADYGEAMVLEAKVTEKVVNENGDLQKIRIFIDAQLDLTKLPAEKPANDEMFKRFQAEGEISLSGLAMDVKFASNPGYKGFEQKEVGLKEWLEKLLARDEQAIKEIYQYAAFVNSLAEELVKEKK